MKDSRFLALVVNLAMHIYPLHNDLSTDQADYTSAFPLVPVGCYRPMLAPLWVLTYPAAQVRQFSTTMLAARTDSRP